MYKAEKRRFYLLRAVFVCLLTVVLLTQNLIPVMATDSVNENGGNNSVINVTFTDVVNETVTENMIGVVASVNEGSFATLESITMPDLVTVSGSIAGYNATKNGDYNFTVNYKGEDGLAYSQTFTHTVSSIIETTNETTSMVETEVSAPIEETVGTTASAEQMTLSLDLANTVIEENPQIVFDRSITVYLSSDGVSKFYEVKRPSQALTEKTEYTGNIVIVDPNYANAPAADASYDDHSDVYGNRIIKIQSGEHTIDFSDIVVKNSNTPAVEVDPLDDTAKANLIGTENTILLCRYVPVVYATALSMTFTGFSQTVETQLTGTLKDALDFIEDFAQGSGTKDDPFKLDVGDEVNVAFEDPELGSNIWSSEWKVLTREEYEELLKIENQNLAFKDLLEDDSKNLGDQTWWNHALRLSEFEAKVHGQYVLLLVWREQYSGVGTGEYKPLEEVYVDCDDDVAPPPVIDDGDDIEPGDLDIEKTASWIDYDQREAQVEFTVQGEPTELGSDIILVIDKSGSMHENSGDSWEPAKDAVNELATSLLEDGKNRVALVQFSTDTNASVHFKTSIDDISKALEISSPKGNTHYDVGLEKAMEYAAENQGTGRPLHVIFVSDGAPYPSTQNGLLEAKELQDTYGATIHSVGINIGVTTDIEAITNGVFVNIKDVSDLSAAFQSEIKSQINYATTNLVITDEISQYFNVKRPVGTPDDATSFEIDIPETPGGNILKAVVTVNADGSEIVTITVGTVTEEVKTYTIPLVLKPEYHNDQNSYPTNGYGDKDDTNGSYTNTDGEEETKEPPTPILSVGQGSITVRYALANINGEYIDANGDVLFDENFRVFVTDDELYSYNGDTALAVSDVGTSYEVAPTAPQNYILVDSTPVTATLTTNERDKVVEFKVYQELAMQANAQNVAGPYNQAPYAINVQMSEADATIMYSLENDGVYDLTSSPEFVDATSNTPVYYQVTKAGYKSVEGMATVEVLPLAVSIVVDNETKLLGTADPAFSAVVLGVLPNESIDYTLSRLAGETVGTSYPINADYTANPNYVVTVFPGVLTIFTQPVTTPPVTDGGDDGTTPPITPPTTGDGDDGTTPPTIDEGDDTIIPDDITPTTDLPETDETDIPDETAPQGSGDDIIDDVIIEDEELPLARGGAWSLFDLIMTIVAVVLAVAYLVVRPRKDEYQNYEEDESKNKMRLFTGIGLSIMAVFSIVLLLITQDFTQPMIVFDIWSVVFAVVSLAQAFIMFFVRKKSNEEHTGYHY